MNPSWAGTILSQPHWAGTTIHNPHSKRERQCTTPTRSGHDNLKIQPNTATTAGSGEGAQIVTFKNHLDPDCSDRAFDLLISLLVILILLLLHLKAFAGCNGLPLCHFTLAVVNDDQKPTLITSQYRFRPPQKGYPTLVYIPGGPGEKASDKSFDAFFDSPPQFGVLLTDPPFIDMQSSDKFKKLMTSQFVADVVSKAIEDAGVESNYILFADSYGTVPATILASQKKPRAVVLEGVVGKARTYDDYRNGFLNQETEILTRLKNKVVKTYNARVNLFLDRGSLSGDQAWAILQTVLIDRHHNGKIWLETLAEQSTQLRIPNFLKMLKDVFMLSVAKHFGSSQLNLNQVINCRELYYAEGHTDETCDGSPKTLFDSAQYQIQSPVIYVVGENDPITPDNGFYHYSNQKTDQKWLVLVNDAGHAPLSVELKNCAVDFWNSFIDQNNLDGAAQVLKNCGRTSGNKKMASK